MKTSAHTEQELSCGIDARNPWPGLVAFAEEMRDFFHGRTEEADELLRRVERMDLTVLFGQSGLGKSSLLQAGLFPRLRTEGYLPVFIRLDHAAAALPLSEQVKAAVARTILGAGGRAENAASEAADTLWEHFHRRGLSQQTSDGEPVRLVLVFDQFEELFAIGQASEETRARTAHFLTELADLIENRAPEALERRLEESPELVKQFALGDRGCRAIICLREDYLPHLESLRLLMPSIAENRMRLTRMKGLRALEAVVNPGGHLITLEVGRQVVRFVAGGEKRGQSREADFADAERENEALAKLEIEPSLLSLVCRELNNHRLALGLPQITADLLAGSRERILQDYYERCVADQPAAVRAFVEDELVTDSGLRENIALERARKALTQRGAPAAAIDDLVKRRLLHLEDRLDIQRVELTHDVLTPVVKKSRDERQQHEATLRAEQQAQEIREKVRRQRRKFRWILAGMAVVLVVVTSFAAWSYSLYRVSEERLLEVERQKNRAEKGEKDAQQAVTAKQKAEQVRDVAMDHLKQSQKDDALLTLLNADQTMALFRTPGYLRAASEDNSSLDQGIKQLVKDRFQNNVWYGATACDGCHSRGESKNDLCRMNEATLWKEKDRHSRAYRSLTTSLGRKIGERLNIKDSATDKVCISCHAFSTGDVKNQDESFNITEGVTCSICHGSDERWVIRHFRPSAMDRKTWRALSSKERASYGEIDLRDPVIRTRVCLSCHLGSLEEGKVVNHAMVANGHPPLTGFEMNAFCDDVPRHWQLLRERPIEIQKTLGGDLSKNETYELVVIGAAVTLRERLRLSIHQTYGEIKTKTWPELSRMDCSGCHRSLAGPFSSQPPDRFLIRGNPRPSLWPLVLSDVAAQDSRFDWNAIKDYQAPFLQQPFGDPKEIVEAEKKLLEQADGLIDQLRKKKYDQEGAMRFLSQLSSIYRHEDNFIKDYDSSRQIAWAFRSVSRSVKLEPTIEKRIEEVLAAWTTELGLEMPAVDTSRALLHLQARTRYDPDRFGKQLERLQGILSEKRSP